MSIAAARTAAMTALAALRVDALCEVRSAPSWTASPSARFDCHYESTPPAPGGPLDYDAGNGYGYTVWFGDGVTIDEKDTVVIIESLNAADVGMELQVLAIPPRGNLGLANKVETVRRG